MPLSRLLALADDLTGALEVAAHFAARGVPAAVAFGPRTGAAELTVIDTESRHLPPAEAAALVGAIAARHAGLIYKKTDSTLRGNIAAELGALARLDPAARIAYIPAYPQLGRTVRVGHLYVDGVPVHQTAFARDPLEPVRSSSVAQVVRGIECTIYDGETAEDVARAVASALEEASCRIIAGPASVAIELAKRAGTNPYASSWPRIERCLIVNGSLHEASRRQIDWAEAHGYASSDPAAPWRIAPCARDAPACLRAAAYDALMVFGGDTAFAILKALGCEHLEALGELMPGLPLSRLAGRDWYLISKAGGYGDETLIGAAQRILHGS
jgi:uncharacterized protein YgbK (DUF1537 family)